MLFLIAHIATRRLAPGADGTLLPLAVLLNGIGYVFIARLDEDLAALQANWTAVGIGAYVAHARRRAPRRATSSGSSGRSGSSACCSS